MFPAASASLLFSLGFGVAAIGFAPLQGLLLTAACLTVTAVSCLLKSRIFHDSDLPRADIAQHTACHRKPGPASGPLTRADRPVREAV